MQNKDQEIWDLLDDAVNSLAILRSIQRSVDPIGAKLTTELIEQLKAKMKEIENI